MSRTRLSADLDLPSVTISESDGVRFLHLDSIWIQGAMNLKRPQEIELEYVLRMMAWTLVCDEAALAGGHAVQLGLGSGAITRFTHGPMALRTTAVEINPSVIAACRKWFRLPADDGRLQVVLADARDWLAEAEAGSVDVLCVDLYDHEAAAPVLDDADFYAACHRVLADGGVMSVNLFGRNASFTASARRIAAAFGSRADRPRAWSVQPTREGNSVVLALRDRDLPPREALLARAEQVQLGFGLPARKWPRMIRDLPEAAHRPLASGRGG